MADATPDFRFVPRDNPPEGDIAPQQMPRREFFGLCAVRAVQVGGSMVLLGTMNRMALAAMAQGAPCYPPPSANICNPTLGANACWTSAGAAGNQCLSGTGVGTSNSCGIGVSGGGNECTGSGGTEGNLCSGANSCGSSTNSPGNDCGTTTGVNNKCAGAGASNVWSAGQGGSANSCNGGKGVVGNQCTNGGSNSCTPAGTNGCRRRETTAARAERTLRELALGGNKMSRQFALCAILFVLLPSCRPASEFSDGTETRRSPARSVGKGALESRPATYLGPQLIPTIVNVREAAYSPDGSRLLLITQTIQNTPYTALIYDVLSETAIDVKDALPPRDTHQILSGQWLTTDSVVITEIWQTPELAEQNTQTGRMNYFWAWTVVDLRSGQVLSTRGLGIQRADVPYRVCGVIDETAWLIQPVVSTACGAFRYDAAAGSLGECLLTLAEGEIPSDWALPAPWIAKHTNRWPPFGSQDFVFINVATGMAIEIEDVPLGGRMALITEDGRFVICSAEPGSHCTQTPFVIDTASGTRYSFPEDHWKPMALSTLADAVLVQICDDSAHGASNWRYYQLKLSDLLP